MDDRAMNNEPLDLIAVEAVGIPMPRAGENAVPGQLPPDPTGLDDLLGSDLGAYDAAGLSGVDADVDADTSMDDQIDTELGAQTLTSRGWTRWDRRDWPNGYRGPGYTSQGSGGVSWAIMPAPRRGWGLSMLNRQGFTASMGPFKSPQAAVEARRAFLAAGGHERLVAASRYTPKSDVLGADYGAEETTMYGNLDDALGSAGPKSHGFTQTDPSPGFKRAWKMIKPNGVVLRIDQYPGRNGAVHGRILDRNGVRAHVVGARPDDIARKLVGHPQGLALDLGGDVDAAGVDLGGNDASDFGAGWTFTVIQLPYPAGKWAVAVRSATGGVRYLARDGRPLSNADLQADTALWRRVTYNTQAQAEHAATEARGVASAWDFGARGTLTVGTSGTKAPRNGVKVFSFRARTVKNARQAVRAALRKFGRLRTVRAALASGVSLAVHAQIIAAGDGSFAVRFYVTKQKAAKLRDIKRQGAAVRRRDRRGRRPLPRKASRSQGTAAPEAWAVEESEDAVYDDTGLPALPDETPPSGGASYSQEQVQAMTRADQPSAADAALAQILMDEESAEDDDFLLSDEGPEGMAGELGARRRRRRPRKRRPGQRRPMSAAERKKILCSRCRRLGCDPEPVASAVEANEEIETVALGGPISPTQALALEYGHIRSVKQSRDTRGRPIVLITFDVDESADVPAAVAGAGFGAAQERIIALPVFGGSVHPVLAELGGCPCKDWR